MQQISNGTWQNPGVHRGIVLPPWVSITPHYLYWMRGWSDGVIRCRPPLSQRSENDSARPGRSLENAEHQRLRQPAETDTREGKLLKNTGRNKKSTSRKGSFFYPFPHIHPDIMAIFAMTTDQDTPECGVFFGAMSTPPPTCNYLQIGCQGRMG